MRAAGRRLLRRGRGARAYGAIPTRRTAAAAVCGEALVALLGVMLKRPPGHLAGRSTTYSRPLWPARRAAAPVRAVCSGGCAAPGRRARRGQTGRRSASQARAPVPGVNQGAIRQLAGEAACGCRTGIKGQGDRRPAQPGGPAGVARREPRLEAGPGWAEDLDDRIPGGARRERVQGQVRGRHRQGVPAARHAARAPAAPALRAARRCAAGLRGSGLRGSGLRGSGGRLQVRQLSMGRSRSGVGVEPLLRLAGPQFHVRPLVVPVRPDRPSSPGRASACPSAVRRPYGTGAT